MTTLTPDTLSLLEQSASRASAFLKSLSNEHRLLILCQLGEGELQVSQLQARMSLTQSALSQHLARLREDGLVQTRREGTAIFYRIADPATLTIIGALAATFCPDLSKEP